MIILPSQTDSEQVFPDIHIIAKEVANRLKLEEKKQVDTPLKRIKRSPISGKSSQRKMKSTVSSLKKLSIFCPIFLVSEVLASSAITFLS